MHPFSVFWWEGLAFCVYEILFDDSHPSLWASLIVHLVKNPAALQKIPDQFWVGKIPWRRDRLPAPVFLSFPGGWDGKDSTPIQETWDQSLGRDDPLKEGIAMPSSILSWRIPTDRGAWQTAVLEVTESDMTERLARCPWHLSHSAFIEAGCTQFLPSAHNWLKLLKTGSRLQSHPCTNEHVW